MTRPLRFAFRFTRSYRLAGLPFGVMPGTTSLVLTADELVVRFGPWSLRTPRSNIASAQEVGGFRWVKTAGPPHLSLADHGVTFATNGEHAVCVLFREPVKVLDPTGRLRHPGMTATVADPAGFVAALS